jgi:CheY-like chemotaxis protein
MFLGRDPELKIVDEAANGAEAIEKACYWRPDVMLMDLLIPVIDGITATAIIRLFSLPFYHTSAFLSGSIYITLALSRLHPQNVPFLLHKVTGPLV